MSILIPYASRSSKFMPCAVLLDNKFGTVSRVNSYSLVRVALFRLIRSFPVESVAENYPVP